jgi:hypothetical protein
MQNFDRESIFLVLVFVGGWVDSMATVGLEGLCQWKILMTPSGMEPATFRLGAQCLNQLSHYMHSPNPIWRHPYSALGAVCKQKFPILQHFDLRRPSLYRGRLGASDSEVILCVCVCVCGAEREIWVEKGQRKEQGAGGGSITWGFVICTVSD